MAWYYSSDGSTSSAGMYYNLSGSSRGGSSGGGAEPQLAGAYDEALKAVRDEALSLATALEDEMVLRLVAEGREQSLVASITSLKEAAT